jgi:hypothetical protein
MNRQILGFRCGKSYGEMYQVSFPWHASETSGRTAGLGAGHRRFVGKMMHSGIQSAGTLSILGQFFMFHRIDRPGSVRSRLYTLQVLPEPGLHRPCRCYQYFSGGRITWQMCNCRIWAKVQRIFRGMLLIGLMWK